MKICSLQSAEKKKTDDLIAPGPIPAAIIPEKVVAATATAPVQKIKPAPVTKSESELTIQPFDAEVEIQQPSIVATHKAKVKPTGFLRKKGVALAGKSAEIADSSKTKNTVEENTICPTWTEDPTIEKVREAWDDFVNNKKKEDRISLVASIKMCEVILEDKTVKFEVKNALQEEQLNSERAGLLFHLRQFVKCADLELKIELEKSEDDSPKMFLTDKEKYEKMVEKNPALDELRKRLDLDLA